MKERLFIQFVTEIYLWEIRVRISKCDLCKKLTRQQIFGSIEAMHIIIFKGKRKAFLPKLSKTQGDLLIALNMDYK
jgi:hypothetical protein